jgi:hypothetical protein
LIQRTPSPRASASEPTAQDVRRGPSAKTAIAGATLAAAVAAVTIFAAPGAATAQGLEVGGSGNGYFLNDSFTTVANHEFRYGSWNDRAYFGDWDGDGTDTLMLRRGNEYLVTQSNTDPAVRSGFTYGRAGDEVLVGDWNGDGRDTLAVRRDSKFHIRNTLTSGAADRVVVYGRSGDTVLVGDWDGDGDSTFAVRRGAEYHVRNTLTSGVADRVAVYGRSGDRVLVGDWNGDAKDTFAVRRSATYFIANQVRAGEADITVTYGRADDVAFAGDWNGNGVDTLGVRRVVSSTGDTAPAPSPAPAPAPTPAPGAPEPVFLPGLTPVPGTPQHPISSGHPGPANTGVPAGVSLRVHNGNMVITEAGTVIDGLDIRGSVDVRAANVTIRNSIIRGGADGAQDSVVRSASNSASLRIVDSEITSTVRSPRIDGLRGWNITAERVDIHHVLDGVHLWGSGNVTVRDSWIHDILHFENDPGWNGGPSHDDTVQIQSGSNITLDGNRIEGSYNAGIIITQDAGRISNVRITDNWLDGGACTVNINEKSYGPLSGIVVSGNVFGDNSRYDCHVISPSSSAIAFSGNSTVTGAPVKMVKN